jgi:hypothetical protein
MDLPGLILSPRGARSTAKENSRSSPDGIPSQAMRVRHKEDIALVIPLIVL